MKVGAQDDKKEKNMIREQLKPALFSFILLTLIAGVFYPLLVTGVAQSFFKDKAEGSLIYQNRSAVGSELIGQTFDDPKYFWGRPSATSSVSYNGAASSGSNLGPINPDFLKTVQTRVDTLKQADPSNPAPVPVDLVTASASGLDPHISLAAAYYQLPRIARLRNLSKEEVKKMIQKNTQNRFGGVLGEPVVNVLRLNLDLDTYKNTV